MMWTRTKLLAAIVTLTLLVGYAWQSVSRWKQSLISQGRAEVQAKWDKNLLDISEAITAEIQRARQREQGLQSLAAKWKKEGADENRRIVDRYELELAGLRDRPEARAGAGGVPEGAAPGVGCTGAGLAGRDARFLAGYAADAARLQLALDGCRAQYEAVTPPGGVVP